MSILEHRDIVCGRVSVYYSTDGVVPTTGGQFQVGDLIINLGNRSNGFVYQCATASPSPAWDCLEGGGKVVSGITAATTVTTADRYVICGAAVAITLPAATAVAVGDPYTISSGGNFTPTVTPAGGNIQGRAAFTLTAFGSITAISDGTNWYIVS